MSLSLNIFVLATAFALLCSVAAYFIYFKILEGTGAGNLCLYNNTLSYYFECDIFG